MAPDTPEDDNPASEPETEPSGSRVITPRTMAKYKAEIAAMPIVAGSTPQIRQNIIEFLDDPAITDSRKRILVNTLKSFARAITLPSFADLKNEHVLSWRATLPSVSSQRTYVASLRMLCARFVKPDIAGWLAENPVKDMPTAPPVDLSLPPIIEKLEGAKDVIDAYIKETYPKIFEGEDGRRPKGMRIPLRHLTALRHFCKHLEEKTIASIHDLSEQDIERYIKEKSVPLPTITMLRQIFEQLVGANILEQNLFFYHGQKTSTKLERSANLLKLLAGDGMDGLTALNAFTAQPQVAKYRSLYVNVLENFAIYALEIAGVKSLREVSPDMMVTYRDGVLLQQFSQGGAFTYFTFIKQFVNFIDEHFAGKEGIPAASYTRRKRAEDYANRTDLLDAFRAAQEKIAKAKERDALRSSQTPAPVRPHAENLDITRDLDYGQRHMLASLVDFLVRNKVRLTTNNRAVSSKENKGSMMGYSIIVAARQMGFIVTDAGVERYTDAFVARQDELKAFSKDFLERHRAAIAKRFGKDGSTP